MARCKSSRICIEPREIFGHDAEPAWGKRVTKFTDYASGLSAAWGTWTAKLPKTTKVYVGTWLLLVAGDVYGVGVVREDFEIDIVYRGDKLGVRAYLKTMFLEHVGGDGPVWERERKAPHLAAVGVSGKVAASPGMPSPSSSTVRAPRSREDQPSATDGHASAGVNLPRRSPGRPWRC